MISLRKIRGEVTNRICLFFPMRAVRKLLPTSLPCIGRGTYSSFWPSCMVYSKSFGYRFYSASITSVKRLIYPKLKSSPGNTHTPWRSGVSGLIMANGCPLKALVNYRGHDLEKFQAQGRCTYIQCKWNDGIPYRKLIAFPRARAT